jgi:hypothetical protein
MSHTEGSVNENGISTVLMVGLYSKCDSWFMLARDATSIPLQLPYLFQELDDASGSVLPIHGTVLT